MCPGFYTHIAVLSLSKWPMLDTSHDSYFISHPTVFLQCSLCNVSLICPFILTATTLLYPLLPLSCIMLPASTEVVLPSIFPPRLLLLDVSFKKMYDQIRSLLKNIQQFLIAFINSFVVVISTNMH